MTKEQQELSVSLAMFAGALAIFIFVLTFS
jgi:hypothetical protein